MRKLLCIAVLPLMMSNTVSAKEVNVTLKDVAEAVHILIDQYESMKLEVERLRQENSELKKEILELKKKFVTLKVEQSMIQSKLGTDQKTLRREMETPRVEVVPSDGTASSNRFPWVTFKRSDVECPELMKSERGYIYYNILVTKDRLKALNIARNVARTGICTVVRKASLRTPLFRVFVIPDDNTARKLGEMGFSYYRYVRNIDFRKSSGGSQL